MLVTKSGNRLVLELTHRACRFVFESEREFCPTAFWQTVHKASSVVIILSRDNANSVADDVSS